MSPFRLFRPRAASGMSRMAPTMFKRLARQEETRTTSKVSTIPEGVGDDQAPPAKGKDQLQVVFCDG